MANVTIQVAIDRIAEKTKALAEAFKVEHNNTNASITAIQSSLTQANALLASLQNNKVESIITQGSGADFETFSQLKAYISDDELVNIGLASGIKVMGVVDETGGNPNDPIIIKGMSVDANSAEKYGTIKIYQDFSVDGGVDVSLIIPLPKGNWVEKVLFKRGTKVAFPTNVTPDATLWEAVSGIQTGDTVVQGTSEGRTTGDNKAHTHNSPYYNTFTMSSSRGDAGNDSYDTQSHSMNSYGFSSWMNTAGTEGSWTKIRFGAFGSKYSTSTSGGSSNKASGIKVKWYQAKIDIITLVKM